MEINYNKSNNIIIMYLDRTKKIVTIWKNNKTIKEQIKGSQENKPFINK